MTSGRSTSRERSSFANLNREQTGGALATTPSPLQVAWVTFCYRRQLRTLPQAPG